MFDTEKVIKHCLISAPFPFKHLSSNAASLFYPNLVVLCYFLEYLANLFKRCQPTNSDIV